MTVFTEQSADERKLNKEKRRRLELEKADRDKVVNTLYQSREGRNYLWWLLEITQAYGHNPYRGSDRDTAFVCGQQNIGQQLLGHMMEVNPAAFAKMLLERTDENSQLVPAGVQRRRSLGGGASDGAGLDDEYDAYGGRSDAAPAAADPVDNSEYT